MVAIFSFIYFVFVMTDMMFMYVFVGILFVLVVFCFAMGLEKMIKLLLGNYLLILLILATNQSLVLLMDFLQKKETPKKKLKAAFDDFFETIDETIKQLGISVEDLTISILRDRGRELAESYQTLFKIMVDLIAKGYKRYPDLSR